MKNGQGKWLISGSLLCASQKIYLHLGVVCFWLTGFSEGSFTFYYLGVPIVSGRLLSMHFEGLLKKVRDRLEGWKTWL